MDGVQKHQTYRPNILVVSFDDEKTSLDAIVKTLKTGDFAVKGKPVYLKAFPADHQSK